MQIVSAVLERTMKAVSLTTFYKFLQQFSWKYSRDRVSSHPHPESEGETQDYSNISFSWVTTSMHSDEEVLMLISTHEESKTASSPV
jgi:hypothetical protein